MHDYGEKSLKITVKLHCLIPPKVIWVFPQMVVPPFHTPKWSFQIGKPWLLGITIWGNLYLMTPCKTCRFTGALHLQLPTSSDERDRGISTPSVTIRMTTILQEKPPEACKKQKKHPKIIFQLIQHNFLNVQFFIFGNFWWGFLLFD